MTKRRIDNLTETEINKYRSRSAMAINGIRILFANPDIVLSRKTIYGKYLTIAKYIGLKRENDTSAYNYFAPNGNDMVFLLRMSNHINSKQELYDLHEKNGRPDTRYLICFSPEEYQNRDIEWNGSRHVVTTYSINAIDDKESLLSFLYSLLGLFYSGKTKFPKLPISIPPKYEMSQDVEAKWNKTIDRTNENLSRNIIRLTESDLKLMVSECVKKIQNSKNNKG
jgi:hypothetical protein